RGRLVRLGPRGAGRAGGAAEGCRRAAARGAHARRRGDPARDAGRRRSRSRARRGAREHHRERRGPVPMNIRWLGHAAFELEADGTTVLIDPWLTGNPKAAASADDLGADAILLTHGHQDNFGDLVSIAQRTGATVVAITEIAHELQETLGEGHTVYDPNMGGTVTLPWGSVRIVPAWHTSPTPNGTPSTPAGLLIELGGKRVYHLGDTCLFSDLKLVKRYGRIDAAIMPIGGQHTTERLHSGIAA